jgi:hypothetical protein
LIYAHLAPSHEVKTVDILDSKIKGEKSARQKPYNPGQTHGFAPTTARRLTSIVQGGVLDFRVRYSVL